MSWKPQLQVAGEGEKWHGNALRFASKEEAEASAFATFYHWTSATGHGAAESEDPVTHVWVQDHAEEVKP